LSEGSANRRGAPPTDGPTQAMAATGPEPLLAALLMALRTSVDAGAAALWSALTPRARAPLGDPAGTRRALANEWLAPLVGHERAELEAWDRRGDVARTRVTVSGGPGGPATFLVSARRGDDGAWRLSGLRRDDLPWG
jgi:hypothetical protein